MLAIVAQAVIKLSRRALKTPAFVALAVAAFAGFAFVNAPFPLVILAAALAGSRCRTASRPRRRRLPLTPP